MVIGKKGNRIWELDFVRGIALILMIIFHILYNLREFYNLPVDYDKGIAFFMGKVSVILFMLLAGIASTLSRDNLRRGLELLLYALLISVATHLWDPQWGIKFGILHFLGTSILLYLLLKGFPNYLLLGIALAVLAGGQFLPSATTHNYLFPFGLKNPGFISSDYYPLIPWFSVFLLGVVLGRVLYAGKRSLFSYQLSRTNPLVFIGANTLPIYLAHQPLLLFVMNLIIKK